MTAHRAAEFVAEVKLFEGLQTTLMVHVRALKQVYLSVLVELVTVVAYGTLLFLSLLEFCHHWGPKTVELLLLPLLLKPVLGLFFSPFLPDLGHVGNETLKELLCILDALIDTSDAIKDLFTLSTHHDLVALSDAA